MPIFRRVTPEQLKSEREQARGLGDVLEKAVKPLAKALKLNCLDKAGKLKPESRCAKRREKLNKTVPFFAR